MHMHACLCVAFTTGNMYGDTSFVCRRWCDYSNTYVAIVVLHHILQVYALQEKTMLSVSTCTVHTPDYMLRQFLLSVRASVLIHEPSSAVLARGTFESIVVTYIIEQIPYTTYIQQWSSFLMGKYGTFRESKSAQECILLMACYLAWYSLFSRSNSM